MSDFAVIVLALITAVPPTLLALGSLLASLRNGIKADSAAVLARDAKQVVDETHKIVNSQRESMTAEIKNLQEKIKLLEQINEVKAASERLNRPDPRV